MKITSPNNALIKLAKSPENKVEKNSKIQTLSYTAPASKFINPELLKAYYIGFGRKKHIPSQDFKYQPLSSLKPVYEPVDCNFSELGEFYKLYANKINSQLMPVSKEDIKALVLRLKESTNADENLINEVLYKLTYYSSYSNLDRIQSLINHYRIGEFRSDALEDGDVFIASSNTALNYITLSKKRLRTSIDNHRTGYILDDGLLSYLEMCKKSSNPIEREKLNRLKDSARKNDVVFLNLPGWDVKCSDDKYRSAIFLYGSGFLEQIAKETILKVQKGENLDDILYGDFSKRLKNVLGEDIKIFQSETENRNFKIEDIYENLKTPTISAQKIKDSVWKFFRTKLMSLKTKSDVITFLKFIDENTYVFSTDSFAMNLVEMRKNIDRQAAQKRTKAFYIVPANLKSFDYVASVYSKINQIENKDVTRLHKTQEWKKHPRRRDLKVILDDICATGETQRERCAELEFASGNHNILYSCLLASKYALMRDSNDEILTRYNFEDLPYRMHEQEYGVIYDIMSDNGYGDISSTSAFPYMTPDSNNEFSSFLFDGLICKSAQK